MKVSSMILYICILCIGVKSWAGEFLSSQELIKRSEAIAVVGVDLRSSKVKVTEWLIKTQQGKDSRVRAK